VSTAGPTTYTSEGCYTEAKGIRALSDIAYYDDAMTVEKCAAACAGYTWFGVEYGRESVFPSFKVPPVTLPT
jgi:hypothetical protein